MLNWLAWTIGFMAIVMITWSLPDRYSGAVRGYRMLKTVMYTASLFWPAVALKISSTGPQWLRWYASDLLLPLLIASGLVAMLSYFLPDEIGGMKAMQRRFRLKVAHWRVGLIGGFTSATVFELSSPLLSRTEPGKYLLYLGTFDLFDVLLYAVGTLIGWCVVSNAIYTGRSELRHQACKENWRRLHRYAAPVQVASVQCYVYDPANHVVGHGSTQTMTSYFVLN